MKSIALALTAFALFWGGSAAEGQHGAPAGAVQAARPAGAGLQSSDLSSLSSVADVHLSPDATRVAYSVVNSDRPGRPYSQVWIMNVATRQSSRLGPADGAASSPRWSPDGRSIAYLGNIGAERGVVVASADGTGARLIAQVAGTNHPLPTSGDSLSWSPDGKQIAFVSSTPGPEENAENANGDPMVITRYLYKPTASEGLTRFNDNRRLHIFVADVGSGVVRQLTSGTYYEHSIDWSPAGDRILFVSNRETDPDRFFNYDLFTVKPSDGSIQRLTNTKNAEYLPVWSPDGRRIAYLGTTRELTSSETTMEDTHVWVMLGDGTNRQDIGRFIDNRQGPPEWAADGAGVYFRVQERGDAHLYRIANVNACTASDGRRKDACGGERVIADRGSLGAWSLSRVPGSAVIAYAFSTPQAPAELFMTGQGSTTALTSLNREILARRAIAGTESFTFKSFDGMDIEAFLTTPTDLPADAAAAAAKKRPLIVVMHGGPHGEQGASFNSKAQIYAGRGWASLMVNYRGSTGYGQKLADAIFGDQNGGEAKDVLAGVDAAIARYPWIDPDRMALEGGSYGGQLANWIITQTDRFKAAIPISGISNLVTQNYLSYYHDYLAVEFGAYPHERGIIDKLWERSAIRYANKVKTPTMFVHGENDNDVPIAEAEQFYIALKDVGVETIMVRYPREGHGIRETKHTIDLIDRSIAWYEKHFAAGSRTSAGV